MKTFEKQLFLFWAVLLIITGFAATPAKAQSNPTQQQTDEWRRKGPCVDPWVSMAVTQANGGFTLPSTSNGSDGECDVSQYNKGQWNSYAELSSGVSDARTDLSNSGNSWEAYTIKGVGKSLFLMGSDGKALWAKLVGNDGASLVGNDGASIQTIIAKMVAAGGGNVVPTGAGRLKDYLRAAGLIGNDSAGILSNANAALKITDARLISNLAGVFSMEKITPTFRLTSVNAKKYFKVGSAYYIIK